MICNMAFRLIFRGFRLETCRCYSTSQYKVGVIGLGHVGGNVCNNVLKHGYTLQSIYDIDKTKGAELPKEVVRAKSPGELTKLCDVIVTALPHPDILRDIAEGKDGIIESVTKGKTWIDHSTTDFQQTMKFASEVEARGGGLLEVPISGGITALKKGSMTAYVGGDKALCDEMTPLLKTCYKSVMYLGPVGHAQVAKLLTNFLCCTHVIAMGEVLMVAKRAGVDLRGLWDAVRVSAGNSFIWETGGPLVFNGSFDPQFTLKLECKDLHLSYLMAKQYGVPMHILSTVTTIYNECLQKYGDDAGCYTPPRLLEEICKEKLQIPGFDKWTYDFERKDGSGIIRHMIEGEESK